MIHLIKFPILYYIYSVFFLIRLIQWSEWDGMGEYGTPAPPLWPAWNHTATSFWWLPCTETVLLTLNAFPRLKISQTFVCSCGYALDSTGGLTALPSPSSWSGEEEKSDGREGKGEGE